MPRCIILDDVFDSFRYSIPVINNKKTVAEKIKELWERSNYYRMLKKMEELKQAMLASKKQKPYYRRHERW